MVEDKPEHDVTFANAPLVCTPPSTPLTTPSTTLTARRLAMMLTGVLAATPGVRRDLAECDRLIKVGPLGQRAIPRCFR